MQAGGEDVLRDGPAERHAADLVRRLQHLGDIAARRAVEAPVDAEEDATHRVVIHRLGKAGILPVVPCAHRTIRVGGDAVEFIGDEAEFKGIRITPNVYTTLGELDRFCNVMETIARKGLPA